MLIGCSNTDRGELVAAEMPGVVDVGHLDLTDMASVHSFAESVDHVDVLVNSAEVRGPALRRTRGGFESHIGVNHLAHFALTCLLSDRIADRVVSVTAAVHSVESVDVDDLNWRRRPYSAASAYEQSKLANVLFVDELARRGVRAYVADPTVAHIGLSRTAARTSLAAVTTELPTGSRLTATIDHRKRRTPDWTIAQRLWDVSAALTDCDCPGATHVPLLW